MTTAHGKYNYTSSLKWSEDIDSESLEKLYIKYNNLSSFVQLKTIENEEHPCNGELGKCILLSTHFNIKNLGVFAIDEIPSGTYIGEYVGQVIFTDNQEHDKQSRFMAYFSPDTVPVSHSNADNYPIIIRCEVFEY